MERIDLLITTKHLGFQSPGMMIQSLLRVRVFPVLLVVCLSPPPAIAADFQSVGLYQSFDEMVEWAYDFAGANSDIVRLVQFGSSHEGRPLLAVRLGVEPDVNAPEKPEFLFTAGLHAREVISSEAAYLLAERLVEGFRTGSAAFEDIFTEREVWIVPNLNPDGRVRVENGDSRHRKNAHQYPGQSASNYTRGVDLNRNFPHRWEDAQNGVLLETYRGPAPLSEPESCALWSLLHDPEHFSDLWAALDYHSGLQSVLTPWISAGDRRENPLPPEDAAQFAVLGSTLADMTGYQLNGLSYNAFGSLTDSLYEEFGVFAFCEELYAGPSYDHFAFFNPTTPDRISAVTGRGIDSALYLLSDAAFRIVPEPSLPALLLAAAFGLMLRDLSGRWRKRNA